MDALPLHPWDLSPSEAVALQLELAALVLPVGSPAEEAVTLIAGADVAFDKLNGRGVGAVVVLRYPSLEVAEQVTVEMPVTFPYVPGLLSFRETPVLLAAFERLLSVPDLLMVDGHGYAHPRRFGFACHLGVLLDVPTIGVAKSRLIGDLARSNGQAGTVAGPRGSRADLTHEGEVIGTILRTRTGVRSVYVSVGHKIGLDAAERWVLASANGYRVPEPTRLADRLAGQAKRRMLEATLPIVIEQRAGEEDRWEWKADTDTVEFQYKLEPMPTHYGCSVDIINPADGELLDVMLLDPHPYDRGERTTVRVIDILHRSDGDDKLLALPIDRPWPSEATIQQARDEIWSWYTRHNKPITTWGGEPDGIAAIKSCRDVASKL